MYKVNTVLRTRNAKTDGNESEDDHTTELYHDDIVLMTNLSHSRKSVVAVRTIHNFTDSGRKDDDYGTQWLILNGFRFNVLI